MVEPQSALNLSPKMRTQIRAALRHGATLREIIEVLELTAILGTQSAMLGLPILMEEITKRNNMAVAAQGETNARPR